MNVRVRSGNQKAITDARRGRGAFSLVEALVVVALIGLVIAIMLPMIGRISKESHKTVCKSNLHSIHTASLSYAAAHKGRLPDPYTTGNFNYRMGTGLVTPNDPAALPENYGWAAVMERLYFMPERDPVWVCPGALPWMQSVENTYAFSTAKEIRASSSGVLILWDNHSFYPGLSGFRGPFTGYNIPTASQVFPHQMSTQTGTAKQYGVTAVYIGGNVQIRAEVDLAD